MVVLHVVDALGGLDDEGVDLGLLLTAPLRQAPAAEQQEQGHPDVGRQEEDREQPCGRRLRTAVARHVDETGESDQEVDNSESEDDLW